LNRKLDAIPLAYLWSGCLRSSSGN
jgi:hypothetical protein